MRLHVVGCGGVGSYLIPALARCFRPRDIELILWDRDTVEKKNLARQNFNSADVGKSKAEVLAEPLRKDGYEVAVNEAWFVPGSRLTGRKAWLFGCVDNHPGRAAVLKAVDENGCDGAVVAGNGEWASDAYIYYREDRATPLDPRVRFPDILTDKSDDPSAPSCSSEEVKESAPQTAAANFKAASAALELFVAHAVKNSKGIVDRYALPAHITGNGWVSQAITGHDIMLGKQ